MDIPVSHHVALLATPAQHRKPSKAGARPNAHGKQLIAFLVRLVPALLGFLTRLR